MTLYIRNDIYYPIFMYWTPAPQVSDQAIMADDV